MDDSTPAPPPAPGRRPVVGHTLAVLRDPLAAVERWSESDADVVAVDVAGRRFCLVTTPGLARTVLADDADDYRKARLVSDRLGSLQGDSLVLLSGDDWRERRRTLQPAMARDRIRAAGETTTAYAADLVDAWPTDGVVDVQRGARDVALAVLAAALFDLDLGVPGETPIHDAADAVLARLDPRSVSAHLPEWVPTPTNRRYRRAVDRLHDDLDALVASAFAPDAEGPDAAVPSLLAEAGVPPETVRDELVAFLFAGYDSTATALTCTLAVLAEHPEIQADVRAELATLPDDRPPRPGDRPDLPTLDAVVRESLRLYPPQYLLFREPTRTVRLGDYRVAAGTPVVVPPWTLHRDPAVWDDPTAFRPDRWRTGADRPEFAYLPYGGGPRFCLGQRLADGTLRLATAVVCRRKRLESVDSLSVGAGPTLAPQDVRVRVTPVR